MIKTDSKILFSYKTVKITQSRINKGLLAIPTSLIDYFPNERKTIYIAFGSDIYPYAKKFTPYTSSSRECRIGGMKNFYERSQIKAGEELVIQVIGEKNKYRILTEDQFKASILKAEKELDKAKDEREVDLILKQISLTTNYDFEETVHSEFLRLSREKIETREYNKPTTTSTKKRVPASMRKILVEIYKGKCQISKFGFLTKNGKPYFELHHIIEGLGNHVKNILVVSPNVHAQFTYAKVEEEFDDQGWLRKVKFNDDERLVKHIIDDLPNRFEKETHYI